MTIGQDANFETVLYAKRAESVNCGAPGAAAGGAGRVMGAGEGRFKVAIELQEAMR